MGAARVVPTVCGCCRSVFARTDAQRCWVCGDDLCEGCAVAVGHCGHAQAASQAETLPHSQNELEAQRERFQGQAFTYALAS